MSYKSLFVNNLHNDVTKAELKKKFSIVGDLDSVHIQHKDGHCFAYINFTYPGHGRFVSLKISKSISAGRRCILVTL